MIRFFIIFLTTLFYLYPSVVTGQGFNTFNSRNHPYLNWKVSETDHFKIIYPQRISGIEADAASIAEETYHTLSKNLEIEFENKIRIYLSDVDEIANGFALPVGDGHTNIWVNLNDYIEDWTGDVKWLRKVISHEIVHIFHFKAVRSGLGLWQFIVADPLPRFFTEGLAQYLTEEWDAQRGDRWLRTAVFDDELDYNDGTSIYNTRLMYAVGNSQVRYFAEQYGDSTLADLLKQRKQVLKLWQVHDFDHAFREVTGINYKEFEDNWRKHINVYYNSLALRMERVDSLKGESKKLPGNYFFDLKHSPDKKFRALLSMPSAGRPVTQLLLIDNETDTVLKVLSEGNINSDISWSPSGNRLIYSRLARADNSSLVNDIFMYNLDSGKEQRITHNSKATSPVFIDEKTIACIINEDGTGNIIKLDLNTKSKTRITNYQGDVQLQGLAWNSKRKQWVVLRFDEQGNRNLIIVNAENLETRVIDQGGIDNRRPVISPDGSKLAFTSLRDEVPNIFIYDFETWKSERVTNLFTGAELFDWIPAPGNEDGLLALKASESKRYEELYYVDASRRPTNLPGGKIENSYSSWRKEAPGYKVTKNIPPDPGQVTETRDYHSIKNLTHTASIVTPYAINPDNWGLFGITNWIEPLGKHIVSTTGLLSFGEFNNSYAALNYVNNQFRPSLVFSAYRIPGEARFYSDRFLIERLTGVDITVSWPLDISSKPFRNDGFNIRFRYAETDPFQDQKFQDTFTAPRPEKATRVELRLGWQTTVSKPYRNNSIHPLDGFGYKFLFTGAEKATGADFSYATLDASGFKILPSIGKQRIYLYGRVQTQFGNPLPQNLIGFSRFEKIEVDLPEQVSFIHSNQLDRVRGYREFITGDQVVFATVEYRVPFLPSLRTRILDGIILGSTSLATFADSGVLFRSRQLDGSRSTEERLGFGIEIKNRISFFGLEIGHAFGIAQKYDELFKGNRYDTYYRVKASVPF